MSTMVTEISFALLTFRIKRVRPCGQNPGQEERKELCPQGKKSKNIAKKRFLSHDKGFFCNESMEKRKSLTNIPAPT